MKTTHKIQLKPNQSQITNLKKACGTARYTYNWALDKCNEYYKLHKKGLNILELKKEWNKVKPDWVYESPKDANQQPFNYLQKAFKSFFKKKSKYPKFKKKGNKDSFYLSNDKFKILDNHVQIPKIGKVKLTEELRFKGKILSGTVSRKADKWFIAINMEIEQHEVINTNEKIIGIDLGCKTFITTSEHEFISAPKPLHKNLKRLKRLNRTFSKKQKGSNNREKVKLKLSRLHYKISCIRNDFLHKTTSSLVSKAKILVIEDLNVRGMTKFGHLAKSVLDSGFYEFKRQLIYKSERNNVGLVLADRWYPSSQICSKCGNRQKLKLSDRTFICEKCINNIDRDLNASINLSTVGHTGINAFGQDGSDYNHLWLNQPAWMKKEINYKSEVCL